MTRSIKTWANRLTIRLSLTGLLLAAALLALSSSSALASKQPVDFIGSETRGPLGGEFSSFPGGVAINNSGAGGVPAGTIYATDAGFVNEPASRVQRFQHEDNGTPANTVDDTYAFVSAWGAGVKNGGTDYEICDVAAECRRGTRSGGNGTLAGNGALDKPSGIAVDQDSGDVYVADHFRINVYSATGEFLRSFGWDVVASGPDDNGTAYEICKAGINVCKSGLPGAGVGQLGLHPAGTTGEGIVVSQPEGNPSTGTVFFADGPNNRVNTYNLDGSSPSTIGFPGSAYRQPQGIAIDSRGILYLSNFEGSTGARDILRYDTENANGEGVGYIAALPAPTNELQRVTINATAGQFRLTFGAETTGDLPYNANSTEVTNALRSLPSIGAGNVEAETSIPSHYGIRFAGALSTTDVAQIVVSNGTIPLNGFSEVTTAVQGHDGPLKGPTSTFTVSPDNDGPGPEADVFYINEFFENKNSIRQYGPVNEPGQATPPSAADDAHATNGVLGLQTAIAVESAGGRIYVAGEKAFGSNASGGGSGIYVLDDVGPPPEASLDSLSDLTSHSVVAHATIDPNGPPATAYHFEYSNDATNWKSTPTLKAGAGETPEAIAETIDPPVAGLQPNTAYFVRLVAGRPLAPPIVTPALSFTTSKAQPEVETVGSPVRTATSARFDGRVNPRNVATSYRFEYGTEGPCDSSPCTATDPQPVGSGGTVKLVSQEVTGLQPSTTYHYRVVAENGDPSGPSFGQDMTLSTRSSDGPLSHGHFPGPPGSDRAYEMVSLPDTSGNPTAGTLAISDDADRVVYRVHGGNSSSDTGHAYNQVFAERTASGWQGKNIYPPREELKASGWSALFATEDLSSLVAVNNDFGVGPTTVFRLFSDAPAIEVGFAGNSVDVPHLAVSDDMSRTVVNRNEQNGLKGVFDMTSGTPEPIYYLPDGTLAPCSASRPDSLRATHWVSADGELAFFLSRGKVCSGPLQLYVRDFGAAATRLVSTPPVSGPTCDAYLIRSTPDAAFFVSRSRLVPADTPPGGCGDTGPNGQGPDGDIYRYDLGDESLECVTCVTAGLDADVPVFERADQTIAVSEDGSRAYFESPNALIAGAGPGTYRVDVASGGLAYVGAVGVVTGVGAAGSDRVGTHTEFGQDISRDGSVLIFASQAPSMNALGGQQNGGTLQYYRYDDRDRSLTCVSCPQDGSAPIGQVELSLTADEFHTGPNVSPLSEDGKTLAFAAPTSLINADQNASAANLRAGMDVYEWRDGRLLLVSDGLTNQAFPQVHGVSHDGRDIFFSAATQYTADAVDAYTRIYDARIGGGFEFPPLPKPCPLEVCQGTPKGIPEEAAPGSGSFSGPGNAEPARKGKPRKKKAQKKNAHKKKANKAKAHKKRQQRANDKRRTAR